TVVSDVSAQLAPGDYIILHDPVTPYYSTTYFSGEMLRVRSVDGAVINLDTIVRGAVNNARTYPAIDTKIEKVNFVNNVGVSDLTIDGGGTTVSGSFIRFENASNVSINNVTLQNGAGSTFNALNCLGVTFTGSTVRNLSEQDTSNGPGYGVALSGACEGVVIDGNHFERLRHGVTTIGNEYGQPHNVVISNNTVSVAGINQGLDTHQAGEDILIT